MRKIAAAKVFAGKLFTKYFLEFFVKNSICGYWIYYNYIDDNFLNHNNVNLFLII